MKWCKGDLCKFILNVNKYVLNDVEILDEEYILNVFQDYQVEKILDCCGCSMVIYQVFLYLIRSFQSIESI